MGQLGRCPQRGLLSPFEPGTRTLPAGYQIDPRFRSLPTDIVFEKDVEVTLRDGVTIYVDVFRPPGSDRVPVIIAWSPYGKSGGTSPSSTGIFDLIGLDHSIVSGLQKFEAPDPAYWCAQGYAICNPDARGVGESGGDSVVWDRQEGQDCYDLIEWLVGQEWCTGRTRTLSPDLPTGAATASYDAATLPGQVRFEKETTLVGYLKAHLWVDTGDADDADVFVLVQKLTANGTPLQQFNTPKPRRDDPRRDRTHRLRTEVQGLTRPPAPLYSRLTLPVRAATCNPTTAAAERPEPRPDQTVSPGGLRRRLTAWVRDDTPSSPGRD